jgi:hypothetical protein
MSIKLPFKPSKAAQAAVAFLSAVSAVGTQALHTFAGFLSPEWAAAITSGLAVIAAVAGFVRTAEPLIDDLDKYAT